MNNNTSTGANMTKQDRFEDCVRRHAKWFEGSGKNRTMAMAACMQDCEAILGRDLRWEETQRLFDAF